MNPTLNAFFKQRLVRQCAGWLLALTVLFLLAAGWNYNDHLNQQARLEWVNSGLAEKARLQAWSRVTEAVNRRLDAIGQASAGVLELTNLPFAYYDGCTFHTEYLAKHAYVSMEKLCWPMRFTMTDVRSFAVERFVERFPNLRLANVSLEYCRYSGDLFGDGQMIPCSISMVYQPR